MVNQQALDRLAANVVAQAELLRRYEAEHAVSPRQLRGAVRLGKRKAPHAWWALVQKGATCPSGHLMHQLSKLVISVVSAATVPVMAAKPDSIDVSAVSRVVMPGVSAATVPVMAAKPDNIRSEESPLNRIVERRALPRRSSTPFDHVFVVRVVALPRPPFLGRFATKTAAASALPQV